MADGGPRAVQRLAAELGGTFALTLTAAGAVVIGKVSGGEVGPAAQAVAPGLVVMAWIYAAGPISGAHLNPAVTLGFASRGVFPWRRVPGYWLAQVAGALLAAGVLRILFGLVAHDGATTPHHGAWTSLAMEIVLTWLLVTVILGTGTHKGLVGPDAALGVGGTIALCGLFAAPISGASMNPARSLGPAVLGHALDSVWIYVLGPFAGALIAVAAVWVVLGPPNLDEARTAAGEKQPAKDPRDGGR